MFWDVIFRENEKHILSLIIFLYRALYEIMFKKIVKQATDYSIIRRR